MGDPAKPFACRVRIGWMRVCGADNLRQKRERRIGQAIFHDDGVERDALAMVSKLATRYVIDDPFPNAFPVGVARNTNSASASMNFLISQGQATLSTLTFSLVIHFMLDLLSASQQDRSTSDPSHFFLTVSHVNECEAELSM